MTCLRMLLSGVESRASAKGIRCLDFQCLDCGVERLDVRLHIDLDPCSGNARILSGPEGSSNKGCLRQARTPGLFFWPFLAQVSCGRLTLRLITPLIVPGPSLYTG